MKIKVALIVTVLFKLLLPLLFAAERLQISINGVTAEIKSNIEARFNAEKKKLSPKLTPTEVKQLYDKSETLIRQAVSPFGYFSPQIHSKLHMQDSGYHFQFLISLNQPVRIHQIHIILSGAGEQNGVIKQEIKKISLHKGDIFNAQDYDNVKTNLLEKINSQGYIKAQYVKSTVLVDTKKLTADILWHIETNQQYFFGDLIFNTSAYSQKFLNRFYPFSKNDIFSSAKLLSYQQSLNDSRFFEQAVVIPDMENIIHDRVPLHASVTVPKARTYTFGLGYGTFTGARMLAGMNWKRLTKSGHSLETQLRLSSVFSGMGIKYFIPGKHPLTEEYLLGLNIQKFTPKNGASHSGTLTLGYNQTKNNWKLNYSLNYLIERYEIIDKPKRITELFYPKIDISYLKSDDAVNPTSAKAIQFILEGASRELFSKTQFVQGRAKGMILVSPLSFAQLIVRGDLGYTLVSNLDYFPLSMQFFSGGMNSVRGFPNNSIGPGKYLTGLSAEYRNHIYGNVAGALFYDIGSASDHFAKPINRSAGIGVIYQSVIGPIKVYVAKPLHLPRQRYRIEFSIGPEF